MLRDDVLIMLMEQPGYVSGAEISKKLGVTRMAVSNAVKTLKEDGCEIDAVLILMPREVDIKGHTRNIVFPV